MPYNSTDPDDIFRLQVNATYIYRMLREHGGLTFVFKDNAAAERWEVFIEGCAVRYFALQMDLRIPQREAKKELDQMGSFYNMCRVETLGYFLEHPEDADPSLGVSESPRKNKKLFG